MKPFSHLLKALAWIAALLFFAAGAMLTYEVTARYLFVAPTIWAAELSQLCLIWGTMIAMPWLLQANHHIAVDVMTDRMGPRARTVCRVLSMAAIALLSAMVAWKGGDIFLESFERGRTTGSMLDMPTWVSELAIPFGFSLLFVQALIELARTPASYGDLKDNRDGGASA
ncbi:TRAP transporter small permease [Labrenzia sp. 011]|uniref:TRAP transporter small permease n=1 Tax=Labrenzia sp. 011 TaxID=2171494 RepID=UPI000D51870C|nr:TRAP transporter small permease [Labrenzia sp. 011]PVB62021.1 C4-dicarboxylate ABC transporter substrate-binding protein [Labrenzia sp. 011]